MNDISHSSEILDQLKSLSIERVDPAMPSAPKDSFVSPTRRRMPFKSLALVALIAGAGAGVWYSQIPPAELWGRAQSMAMDILPADLLAKSKSDSAQTEAAQSHATPSAPAQTPAPATQIAPVIASAPSVVGSGYVVADRELALMPDIGGRIESLSIETGSPFIKGQIIAVLDSGTAQADLRIAEANLSMAQVSLARSQSSLDEARAGLVRLEKLLKRGSVPRTQVETARYALIRLEGDVKVDAQQIEIAKLQVAKHSQTVARHRVYAPFSGIVVERHLNEGDMALSAQDAGPNMGIATLIDPQALTIEVDVAENNLSNVTPGQKARVKLDAYPTRDFAAVVKTIAPKVSIQKGTVQVRLTFERLPSGVFANMAAKVTFDALEQTAALYQKGN